MDEPSNSEDTRTVIRRPRDTNQQAKLMVDIATDQFEDGPDESARKAVGGHARAESLSAERRGELAARAGAARWARDD